jgi:hypothetical protein
VHQLSRKPRLVLITHDSVPLGVLDLSIGYLEIIERQLSAQKT